jgi:hypothetical protein
MYIVAYHCSINMFNVLMFLNFYYKKCLMIVRAKLNMYQNFFVFHPVVHIQLKNNKTQSNTTIY